MSEIKTNQISSLTGSNSDITLNPDGTGDVVVSGSTLTANTTDNFPITWQGASGGATGALYGDGSAVGMFNGAAFTTGVWANNSNQVYIRNNGSNNITVNSDGLVDIIGEGTATTNLQNGLSKAWANYDQTGTFTTRDSLNISSISDAGTGNANPIINNNMTNGNYSATSACNEPGGQAVCPNITNPASTDLDLYTQDASDNSRKDADYVFFTIHGDLA